MAANDPAAGRGNDRNTACLGNLSHIWTRRTGDDGFPKSMACLRCGVHAPEAFCRTPQTCYLAGRCLSEIACNE